MLMNRARSGARVCGAISAALAVALGGAAAAATIDWKGHTWQVTSGGMAGVCQGSPGNVTIDANGYLHFKISNAGGVWTASEIFTTDVLGFGTYQWQVDGPIDSYDKNVVLGLFPYGPAAGIGGDGTNEIDVEYSRWGHANAPNGDWTDYPASGTTIGELTYTFSLGGSTLSTSRFAWTKTSITSALLGGLQPVDATANLIETWTYMPANPSTNIPQQALPLGMNLWCFDTPPSDGKPVEIVIRDFQFVPEGASTGAAGSGGAGAVGTVGADGGTAASGSAGASAATSGSAGAAGHASGAHAGGCSVRGGGADALSLGALGVLLACVAFARRRR
jgi:MYXO-CTERM domain-containing protein